MNQKAKLFAQYMVVNHSSHRVTAYRYYMQSINGLPNMDSGIRAINDMYLDGEIISTDINKDVNAWTTYLEGTKKVPKKKDSKLVYALVMAAEPVSAKELIAVYATKEAADKQADIDNENSHHDITYSVILCLVRDE